MDTTPTEGWVRGQWAALHSLTVPESNTGAIQHSSQARTTVLVRRISCHMGSVATEEKVGVRRSDGISKKKKKKMLCV